MGKSKSKSHKANASKLRNRALNAFDIAGDDIDNRAERRLGRATVDNQAKANGSDEEEEEVDYLSGEVKSEDDEEIDSDTAFPSDDDFDLDEFMGGASQKKKYNKKKPKALTLDESEDDESDSEQSEASIDEGEFVSLSEAWDMDTKDDQNTTDSKPEESDALTLVSDISGSDSGSDEEDSLADSESEDNSDNDDDDEDDELDFSDISDDGMDEEQLTKLRAQISDLSKKAGKEEAKKVRKLEVNNLAEGEFSIPASNKLTLADLTAGSKGTANSSIKLMKSLTKTSGENKKITAEALNIPLPRRIQERYDRAAAFEVAKEEVDKWKDTVQSNRQAEHLVFPMNKETPLTKQTASAPIQPTTELEKKVDGLLKESSLSSEKTLTNFEELAPSKLSMEEVKRRRNELRMMRELLFREEQKAKRIKKIKSKSYRRVHKKERERLKAMVEGSDDELDKEGLDMERARERMSLKHKNTGKWAKRMVEQGFTKDKETRSEMEEMLRRGETLRKKIMGEGQQSDSEMSDEVAEDFEDEEEATDIKKKLEKGIMGMNFIKEHQAKQRASNERNMELLEKAEEEDGWEELADRDDEANEFITEGRMKFAPGSKQSKSEVKQLVEQVKQDAAEESSMASRLAGQHKSKATGPKAKKNKDNVGKETIEYRGVAKGPEKVSQPSNTGDESSDDSEENPWLTESDGPKKRSSKTGVIAHGNNTTFEKQTLKAKKQRSQTGEKQDQALIDMNQTLSVVDPYGSDNEDGAQSESENMIVAPKNKKLSFKQKDLVKRAFAGDDVVTEFQEEKRARIEEEGDKEVDITLPGWGSWGGDGLAPAKKVIKKISGVKAENRKDAKLKNVIINEKVNKKNAKYNSSSVPFPFESREQYERSLRTPVGQEWTSKSTFQKLTKPRVLVKKGVVIDPLKAPFK